MNNRQCEVGILQRNTIVKDLTKVKGSNERTGLLGTIVKIQSVLAKNNYGVKFLKNGDSWESTVFSCSQNDIICVYEKFWPYLAAVVSPIERVNLAKDPVLCEKLMQISKESIVIFTDDTNIDYMGTVKYVGNVKGIGFCFGIKLHKKLNTNCDGSCAGIQYFSCLPGYGIFTTVDKIRPQNMPGTSNLKQNKITNDLDAYAEKNVVNFSLNTKLCDKIDKKYEEIVTTYREYPKHISDKSSALNRNSSYFRNSRSLQNILDVSESTSVNTNNDFDQNTIIQPDDTYLIHEQMRNSLQQTHKNKSEMDLIDAIGGSWSGTTDQKQLDSFSNLRKSIIKNDVVFTAKSYNNVKSSRNKSLNPLSHLLDTTKTLPKKTKFLHENSVNKNHDFNTHTFKYEENNLKLNEKSDLVTKSPPSAAKTTPSTSHNIDKPIYYDPEPGTTDDLTIGSLVEVSNDITKDPLYGVIRWMGIEASTNFILVGIELEEEHVGLPLTLTDGTHNGDRFFECGINRALFVPIKQCHKDSRFQDGTPTPIHQVVEKVFDKVDCPVIQGSVAPLCMPTEEDVEAVCGKFRGIQGHHNSCYLDVTLFSMFTYTAVFDSLLFRPKGPNDVTHYEEVQRVLREEIVNPLRKNLFVRADRVMNLRKLLDQLSNVSGLTSEEKDPEEFLNSLLAQILKAEPFLKLNSGQEAYHYQLFVEKDDDLTLPSVQQLFEQSFLTSDIKLKEVPSCLIIQMPRFGKSFKMYPRILPSQLLDVTDIIENSPRQCTVCGKLAKWECKECFGECGVGLESTAFCSACLETAHSHIRRSCHSPRQLTVSSDFSIMEDHCSPPRLYMELFAVICIETSHYVAFVKCGVGHEAPWCFFDSMADRKGEKNGYNIPEMVACPDVSKWLSDEQICRKLSDSNPLDRYLPEHARRLLCDAYICMYQSPDVMMYR